MRDLADFVNTQEAAPPEFKALGIAARMIADAEERAASQRRDEYLEWKALKRDIERFTSRADDTENVERLGFADWGARDETLARSSGASVRQLR